MYNLVKDVEAYPDFLPWCNAAEVHTSEQDFIEASIELHHRGIRKRFRTRNALQENESLGIELVGGPFRRLSGGWRFMPLGDAGSKVSLDLEFEFENKATDVIFGRFFEKICNTLVDSFTRRAAEMYATPGGRHG
jgi:ribosome-associated toxin RatA of RatAB toxin-antitoxin module